MPGAAGLGERAQYRVVHHALKAGTKVRNYGLVDEADGHDIDCRFDGFGAMQLKSGVVRKA